MALPPADAAPAEDMADEEMPADAAPADDAVEPGDENVLFTVCKEPDGTYSLIMGDEEDASGADTAGSADMEEPAADKQTFDSPGPLLKAILDVLKEDMASSGGEGSSEDQFQSGYDEAAPAKPAAPAAPMAKY